MVLNISHITSNANGFDLNHLCQPYVIFTFKLEEILLAYQYKYLLGRIPSYPQAFLTSFLLLLQI